MGHVAQPERDRIEIEAAVGEGQPLGIGRQPFDAAEDAPVERAGAADLEHALVGVADDGAALGGIAGFGHEPRQRAQAMSPVPPATSIRRWPGRGFSHATISAFHNRWMPPLIRSFIRS